VFFYLKTSLNTSLVSL